MPDSTRPFDRRRFLGTASAAAALAGSLTPAEAAAAPMPPADADGRPPVTSPRATSGDARHAPKWDELFTLTVGNDKGDLCGTDQRVIQAAVDTVARVGGGTVRLLPGTWRLRNAVYLCSHLRLVGSGPETVLVKEASVTSKLAADSDWYDQEIILFRPERGAGFTGDRNTVEGNTVVDTGGEDAAAVDVQGTTAGLVFRGNVLKETRGPARRVGFRLGKDTTDITLDGNTVEGFATKVDDRRR